LYFFLFTRNIYWYNLEILKKLIDFMGLYDKQVTSGSDLYSFILKQHKACFRGLNEKANNTCLIFSAK